MSTQTTPTRYRVTAACVTAKTMALAGMHATHVRNPWTTVTLYRDAYLPADCPAEQVASLLRKGMVEEVTDR